MAQLEETGTQVAAAGARIHLVTRSLLGGASGWHGRVMVPVAAIGLLGCASEDLRVATANLVAAAEVDVDRPLVPGAPAAGVQQNAALAFNGTHYLAIWEDSRQGNGIDVFGVRVGLDGQVTDVASLPIATGDLSETLPEIASDGAGFLAAWQVNLSGQGGIRMARLSPEGAVLDPGGRDPARSPGDLQSPGLAFGGGQYLLTWRRLDGGVDWIGALVHPDGQAGPEEPYFPGTGPLSYARAMGDVDGHLLLLQNVSPDGGTRILARRRWADGGLDAPVEVVSSSRTINQVTAAPGRNGALVVWTERSSPGLPDLMGRRAGVSGAPLAAPLTICSASIGSPQQPAVAFAQDRFQVVWVDGRDGGSALYGAAVPEDGGLFVPCGVPLRQDAGTLAAPAIAAGDGRSALLAWHSSPDFTSAAWDVLGLPLGSTGWPALSAPAALLSRAAPAHQGAAMAFDGQQYLISWIDRRYAVPQLLAARVSPEGTLLDVPPILLGTGPGLYWPPAVAAGGGTFLVLWSKSQADQSSSDLRAARVTSQGAVLDPGGALVADAAPQDYSPVLAFDGQQFLAAWLINAPPAGVDVRAAWIDARSGLSASPPVALSTSLLEDVSPSVSCAAGRCAVAYYTLDDLSVQGEVALHLFDGGAPGPALSLERSPETAAPVSVAASPAGFLVSWYVSIGQVIGRRVSPAGTLLDASPLGIGPSGSGGDLCSLFDGASYRVVWTVPGDAGFTGPTDLAVTTVLETGATGSQGLLIDTPTRELGCDLASPAPGELVVAYVRYDPAPAYQTTRARLAVVLADGGTWDAGQPGNVQLDGGGWDGGPPGGSDGGSDAGDKGDGGGQGEIRLDVGCSCGAAGSPWIPLVLILLCLGAARRSARSGLADASRQPRPRRSLTASGIW